MVDEQQTEQMRQDMDMLREDLNKLRGDFQNIAQSMMDRGKNQARQARDRMSSQMETGMQTLEEYVEKRPMTTLLSAFGVGLVIGTLFSRK